jgi:hypothetical protein
MSVTCLTCDSEVQIKDKNTHSCIMTLKSMIRSKNDMIEELQNEIMNLKS